MGKKYLWILLGIVIIISFLTCPTLQDHRTAATPVVSNVIQEVSNEAVDVILNKGLDIPKLFSSPIATLIRLFFQTVGDVGLKVTNFIINLFDENAEKMSISNFIEVENYYLFSLGYFRCGDFSSLISFGIFGHVFVFSQDSIKSDFEELINNFLSPSMNIGD